MKNETYENFIKCFVPGHLIELEWDIDESMFQIMIFDKSIDIAFYSDKKIAKSYVKTIIFEPKEFTSFDKMVNEFLNVSFIDGKSINELQNIISVKFNTAGI